jgi:hypothetical protein
MFTCMLRSGLILYDASCSRNAGEGRNFRVAIARDAQSRDWLLERSGFKTPSPLGSRRYRDLVVTLILPRIIA